MRHIKVFLALLGLLIPSILLATIKPHAGVFRLHGSEGSEAFDITLVAKNQNFQFSGKNGNFALSGTLYGSTGKIRGMIREINGKHREFKLNGYWNFAHGRIEVASPDEKTSYIFEPAHASADTSAGTFTGTWKTDFGTMTLTQSGKHVSGKYDYYSGEIEGDIKSDGNLYFKWTQKNPDKHGTGFFKLSGDDNTFSGSWDYTNASGAPLNNGGGWSGRRIK